MSKVILSLTVLFRLIPSVSRYVSTRFRVIQRCLLLVLMLDRKAGAGPCCLRPLRHLYLAQRNFWQPAQRLEPETLPLAHRRKQDGGPITRIKHVAS
jgi:hypothetical protein